MSKYNYQVINSCCIKNNMLTFSGCMQARLELMMLPVQLKTFSDGTLVAGTRSYSASNYRNSSITDYALE